MLLTSLARTSRPLLILDHHAQTDLGLQLLSLSLRLEAFCGISWICSGSQVLPWHPTRSTTWASMHPPSLNMQLVLRAAFACTEALCMSSASLVAQLVLRVGVRQLV